MTKYLCIVCFLFAVPAWAQVHPCDQPQPTDRTVPSGVPLTVEFCAKLGDQLIRVDIQIDDPQDTDAVDFETRVQAVSGPNGDGFVLFQTELKEGLTPGLHRLQMRTVNADFSGTEQESPWSEVVTLNTLSPIPPPAPPRIADVRP